MAAARCPASSFHHLSQPLFVWHFMIDDCSTLVEVVLNDGLQRIGGSAFARCISLIRIDIPPSVTVIDDFAFSYCTALEEVVLHEGLKTIGGSAFIGCRSLIHIVIPRSVTAIGENAFNGSGNITTGFYVEDPVILRDTSFTVISLEDWSQRL